MAERRDQSAGAPTRIAVSTDLSEASTAAFGLAASLARSFSARLLVVFRSELPRVREQATLGGGPGYGVDSFEDYQEDEEARLHELVHAESSFEGLEVEPRLLRDVQTDSYSRFLKREGIDLLVLATHGRSGWRRLLMGSFAERVLRTARCPTLAVRCEEGAARRECRLPSRILVPTDFSDCSQPAGELARTWARHFDAHVRLLHVVVHDPGIFGYARDVAESWYEYYKNARFEGSARFEALIEEDWQGIEVDYQVTAGLPGDEVAREATEYGADLIVMGTHGRSGFEHFIAGSVAEATLRKAPCPALVVPAVGVASTVAHETEAGAM